MVNEALVVDVQPNVEITIDQVGGDLVIEGKSEAVIRAKGDKPHIHVEGDGRRALVSCGGDCTLTVPADATFVIENVGADAMITCINGAINVGRVGADLVLRDVGRVSINQVGAELTVKRAAGSVEIITVGADADFTDLSDGLTVETIGGAACLRDIVGICTIENIGGDLVSAVDFAPDTTYRFGVGANVLCRIDANSDVRFIVPSPPATAIEIPDVEIESDGIHDTIILGNGTALVEFTAIGGDLRLANSSGANDPIDSLPPLPSLAPQPPLPPRSPRPPRFGPAFDEELDEIVNARISEQIAAVQDRLNRNAEQLQRKAEHMKDKALSKRITGEFKWPAKDKRRTAQFQPPWADDSQLNAPSEPVSDQERIIILRMVENKQITVEEAERLLAALDGNQ
ncbi:MAG: hypothetical protein ABI947_24870 [Chloroflexota bacterium]